MSNFVEKHLVSIDSGFLRLSFAISLAASLSGCAEMFYAKVPTGKFSGKLDVEWIAPNQFIYRPHSSDPLIYLTAGGQKIQPRTMFTDGGSIPRLFWSASGFGPWDFAPGYIIHDWLFEQHHCREGDWQQYDFSSSARILAEAMKTQLVKAGENGSALVWAVHEAVRSPIAQRLWENGQCKPLTNAAPSPAPAPGRSPGSSPSSLQQPIKILTIDFN